MAKPKIKEKRWTVDLEKKIQEEHFSNKDRYSFNPNSEKEIFVIDTPPPYPSGTWHIGAVAQYSMIDVIARSQRLLGKEVYFPWGVDRNGINIEFTVEKKTGRKMKTYDRAEFLDLCRDEIEKYTQEMRNIAKRVGLSCAYDQEYLTDAPDYRSVTQSIFIDLFKTGAIVEELRPNLYDPVEGTTIAEAEVERLSRKSKLLDVRWSVTDDSEHDPVIISTTRPELIFACGIVLVHPDDSRYQHLVGKSLDLPMPTEGRSKSVEVMAHPSVNMEFGSGVLMVSSFGDQNDVAVFRELGLSPLARMAACSVGGVDPIYMGIGPCEAIPKALNQAGLKLNDIEQTELNEAFAAQSLAVIQESGLDPSTVNVNGGAVALGHPLGCTGAKLTIQLLNEMRRRNQKYGMVTACVGGGQGIAGIFERL